MFGADSNKGPVEGLDTQKKFMHKALDINIHCKKLVTSSMICNGLCCMKELVYTENATFNFWALETCRKFLIYFWRIIKLGTGQTLGELYGPLLQIAFY